MRVFDHVEDGGEGGVERAGVKNHCADRVACGRVRAQRVGDDMVRSRTGGWRE